MAITGIYTKDFPNLGRDAGEADLIPIAEVGNIVTKKTPVSGLITSARVVGALGFTPYGATPGTVGKLAMFGSTDLQNSLLSQSGNQINLGTYAAFGVNNPGTPGDPGVDNDAWIGSIINNDFLIKVNNIEAARFDTALRLKIANIPNATTDTDKFLVSDGGVVKYRTGSELLSDIGGVSAGDLSGYVTLATAQTITGAKIFTQEILVNSVNIGRGGGNISGNTRVGNLALNSNTTGEENTAIGLAALQTNFTGSYNTAIGNRALDNTTAGNNTAIGRSALSNNTTGGNNTAIGDLAGVFITTLDPNNTPSNSVFIGANTRAQDDNQTNQIVIGDSTTGNGSNTVTIGNSSIINNYFSGNVRGGAFIKSGGTSTQFLKADGSIDSNSYLPLTGGTLESSGSANTLNINHTSGSGIALNISKSGNGEGLKIVKGSGSGNAASITGGITLLSELNLTTKLADAHIASAAVWNAKIGGSGTTNYLAKFTASGVVGNSAVFDNGTNVGIGTTSPSRKLEVSQTGDAFINIRGSYFNNSGIIFSDIDLNADSCAIRNDRVNNALWFSTSGINTERMRITSGGDVLVGCTSVPGAGGTVQGVGLGSVGYITALRAAATVGFFGRTNAGELFAFYNNTTQVGDISVGASSTSYNTSSDYRLKQDLKDYSGLSLVNNIKTYDYEWKSDKSRMHGVLAHELQEVLPYAVTGEKDAKEMQSVDYSKLVPVLVKAIQEQQAQIEELKALINK